MATNLLIGIRFALYADLMLIVGLAAFALYALKREERRIPSLLTPGRQAQIALCWIGFCLSSAGMILLVGSMNGVAPAAVRPSMFASLVEETDVGMAWLYRTIALLIALGAAYRLARNPGRGALAIAIAGSVALASLVWSGHAGATEGMTGTLHRISDAIHMIAGAVWLGGIAGFLLVLRRTDGEPDHGRLAIATRGLGQFARVGTICVTAIAATGLVNSQIIIGAANIGPALGSPYARLLALKLLLFAAMLALAAANRWRLTPALEAALIDSDADPAMAAAAMRRSLIAELMAGAAILALVAWLGTLDPFAPGVTG